MVSCQEIARLNNYETGSLGLKKDKLNRLIWYSYKVVLIAITVNVLTIPIDFGSRLVFVKYTMLVKSLWMNCSLLEMLSAYILCNLVLLYSLLVVKFTIRCICTSS